MYGDKEEGGEQREENWRACSGLCSSAGVIKESLGTDQSSGRKERHIPLG